MKTKRGAAGNLLCSHHVNHQQVLALATAPPLASCTLSVTTPRTSGRHRPRGAVDTCRRPGLFRRPKHHRIAAQICRVDRPLFSLTCTATAATTTTTAPTPVRTITSVTAHVVLSDTTKLYGSHTMITDVAMDVPRPCHGDSFDERVAKLRHKLIELLGNN